MKSSEVSQGLVGVAVEGYAGGEVFALRWSSRHRYAEIVRLAHRGSVPILPLAEFSVRKSV